MKNTNGDPGPTVDLRGQNDLEDTVIVSDFTPEEVASPDKGQKKDVTRRVGLVFGSSPSLSAEFLERLRTRLRLSALLLGSGLGVYLMLKLFNLFQTAVDLLDPFCNHCRNVGCRMEALRKLQIHVSSFESRRVHHFFVDQLCCLRLSATPFSPTRSKKVS